MVDLNFSPQFLQAKVDQAIPPILRYGLILFFYLGAILLLIFQQPFFKLFLAIFLVLSVLEIYFYSRRFLKAKTPFFSDLRADISYNLAKILLNCQNFSLAEIFEKLLKEKEIRLLLEKVHLHPDLLKNQIKLPSKNLTEADFKNLFTSRQEAVEPIDLFFNIVKRNADFIKISTQQHLSIKDLTILLDWYYQEKLFKRTNFFSLSPVGLNWYSGYTPLLDEFSLEIRDETIKNWHNFLHQDLIKQIVVAIYNGRLPVLIGKIGSGRKSVIYSLLKMIKRGQAGKYLNFRRALELKNEELLAKFASFEEIDKVALSLFYEAAWAGNIFLIITDLDKTPEIVKSLTQFIGKNNFTAVAVATLEGIEKIVSSNEDFSSKIEKIYLKELTKTEILTVLMDKAWEGDLKITLQALKKIMEYSEKFDPYLSEPLRSINYLQEIVLANYQTAEDFLHIEEVEKYFSQRFNVSLGAIKYEERQKLLNIKELFHKEMVNQEQAIEKLTNALKSARLGFSENKKPIASFLFLGPTGVGKTTAAKVVAREYFGSEEYLVRVDLNEFSDAGSIGRFIDSENEAVSFFAKVKKNAQGVLLLDEIEKAHLEVKNALLQMLDEGYLTDKEGRNLYFNNYIIIATSNAGSEFIRENIDTLNDSAFDNNLKELLLKKQIFLPEFLNRFDSIIAFKPLSQEDVFNLTKMLLSDFAQKLKEDRNIRVNFSQKYILEIAQKGYSPQWGARQLKRVISDEVESVISQKIIDGSLKEGDEFLL